MFSSNDGLKNIYTEISLSPMMSIPFETFYFKDYLIDCSVYDALSLDTKFKNGYGYI